MVLGKITIVNSVRYILKVKKQKKQMLNKKK